MRKIKILLIDNRGFAMVNFLVMFALIFPLAMLIPDMILWGSGWVKAQSVVNETAQFLGEHGGADENTVKYLQNRFESAGLNPDDWHLTLTAGPIYKGQQGVIAVESGYTFSSVGALGIDVTIPVHASATYTSEVFLR